MEDCNIRKYTFNELLNTITLGDSYEVIKSIPDNTIDLVYIDIPYLIEDGGCSSSSLSQRMKKIQYGELEQIRHGIDYTILDELCRVLKKYIYIYLV